MALIPDRIGAKLNVSILLFLVLLAAATAALVYAGFERTQNEATESSERGLEAQGREALAQFASFNAGFGQAQLDATASLAQQAARFMSDPELVADAPVVDPALFALGTTGNLHDTDPSRRTDVLVTSGVLDDAAMREIRESAALDVLFPSLLPGFSGGVRSPDFDAVAIHFNGLGGVTRIYPRSDEIGSLEPQAIALASVGPEANPERATVWTAPYEDVDGERTLTAMSPVYVNDEFRGAVSVDLSLTRLSAQVDAVRPTPGGYAFYIDRDGALLPTTSAPTVQAAIDDESNEAFADTLLRIRNGEAGVDNGVLQGRDVFIAYAPLQGVGGALALVAPVDEMTLQAEAVAESIEDEENRTVAITLAVMAGFFVAALAGTAFISRRLILRPIEGIVRGTRAVAAGDLESRIEVTSGDELGVLGESFNSMTAELANSRAKLDAQREQTAASEAELRALFAAMTDVVFVISGDGEYLRAAPTIPALAESNRNRTAGLIGKRVTDVMEPGAGEGALAAIRAALDGGGTQSFEYRIDYEYGESRWYNAAVTPMTADTVLWVARDVTRRLRDEQIIAEREQQYRSIFEAASDALFITDLEDRIIDANPAACAMHGYTVEEIRELQPFALTDEAYRAGAMTEFHAIGAGRPRRGRMRNVRKDGTSFPVDAMGTPITYRGAPHVLVVMRDITDQVESERLLEQRVADRTREVSALLHVSQAVASSLDLHEVAQAILQELEHVADYTGATLAAIEGDELVILDSFGPFREEVLQGPTARIPLRTVPRSLWKAMEAGGPIVIDDTGDDSPEAQLYRRIFAPFLEMASFKEIRSWLAVPLTRQGEIIGMLTASHEETHHFTAEMASLVLAAAGQTAVALENARLFEQTEQRTRELTTLLDVSRNVASTLELQPLLRLVLEQVAVVAEYDRASVLTLEENRLRVLCVIDHRGEFAFGASPGAQFNVAPNSDLWAALSAGQVVLIDDVRDESVMARSYRQDVAPQVDPELQRGRGFMAVPLMLHDRIIGIFALTSETVGAFDRHDGELVQAIGAQAAVAIENARLYEESQQRARETEALLRADEELFRSLDLDDVMQALVDVTIDVMRADKCILTLVENGEESVRAARNFSPEGLVSINRQVGERSRQGLRPPDHPFVLNDINEERRPQAREMWAQEGLRSYMALPILAGGELIGGFGVGYTSPHAFGEGEKRVFKALAERGGAAIENAALYERAQTAASLEERQRLARELHDSVSQALYGIALGARTARTQLDRDASKAVEPVDYVLSLAEAGLAEMRALIFELRPESLETEGLIAGLEKQAAALRARHSIEVEADLCEEPDVPLAIKEAVSRIAQEAMHNTVKHARASHVWLRLAAANGSIALEVRDDGRGFDPTQPYAGHLGLRSMRERAEKLGGTIAFESAEGQGARVRVSIPVPG